MRIDTEQFDSDQEKHFCDNEDGQLLTPKEAATKLKVTTEQIRCLIRKGQLSAVNVGTGAQRPLYRITQHALNDFLNKRWQPVQTIRKKRFKQLAPSQDFFPNLK